MHAVAIRVGQQREAQRVLVVELLLLRGQVRADAQDDCNLPVSLASAKQADALALPPGVYRLTVSSAGFAPHSELVDILGGAAPKLETAARPPTP